MRVEDLGTMPYRQAWAAQEAAHAQVLAGGEERLFLVEHPPVITFGRRPGVARNLIATDEELARLGVEVVQSDRGGDITFHGPGQLVVYPIVRLNDHRLSVGAYVHGLERAVIGALRELGVEAHTDPAAVGIWTRDGGHDAKLCAIGVRIKRGVSLHGLAVNLATDLRYFDLIVPCGLTGRAVTSLQKLLADTTPPMAAVRPVVTRHLEQFLGAHNVARATSP